MSEPRDALNVELLAEALHIWFVPLPKHTHCERDHGARELAAAYATAWRLLYGDGIDPEFKTSLPSGDVR
jgi:hypothetical protein